MTRAVPRSRKASPRVPVLSLALVAAVAGAAGLPLAAAADPQASPGHAPEAEQALRVLLANRQANHLMTFRTRNGFQVYACKRDPKDGALKWTLKEARADLVIGNGRVVGHHDYRPVPGEVTGKLGPVWEIYPDRPGSRMLGAGSLLYGTKAGEIAHEDPTSIASLIVSVEGDLPDGKPRNQGRGLVSRIKRILRLTDDQSGGAPRRKDCPSESAPLLEVPYYAEYALIYDGAKETQALLDAERRAAEAQSAQATGSGAGASSPAARDGL